MPGPSTLPPPAERGGWGCFVGVHRVPRSSRSRYPTLGFRQAAATVTDARPALSSSSTPRPTRTGPTWSSMRES